MKILALVLAGLLLAAPVFAQGKCTPEQREQILQAGKEGLICEVYDHNWRLSPAADYNKELEKGILGPMPGEERVCRVCGKKQRLERGDDQTASWVDGEYKREKKVNFDDILKEYNQKIKEAGEK
jgi:hypothetical protein